MVNDDVWFGHRKFLNVPCRAFFAQDILFLSDDVAQIDENGEDNRTVFELPRDEAVRLAKWILEQEEVL